MKEKATIFDYARMCKEHKNCRGCLLSVDVNGMDIACLDLIRDYPDKANEIILNWCKEHPIMTRQSKIQKIIPNLVLNDNGCLDICPIDIDGDFYAEGLCNNYTGCGVCKKRILACGGGRK